MSLLRRLLHRIVSGRPSDNSLGRPITAPEHLANFWRWFGKSVCVDDQGRPLVLYRGQYGHAGDAETRDGSFTFTNDSKVADLYAQRPNDYDMPDDELNNIVPHTLLAYLKIERPAINQPDDAFVEGADLQRLLGEAEAKRILSKFSDEVEHTNNWQDDWSQHYDSVQQMLEQEPDAVSKLFFLAYPWLDDHDEVALLKRLGYDGAIHRGNAASMDALEYKVFGKAQIKSVFNSGKFKSRTNISASDTELLISQENIEQVMDIKCIGYTYIDPWEFLLLTTGLGSKSQIEQWIKDEKPFYENRFGGWPTLDLFNQLVRDGKINYMPFLSVDEMTGKIKGHEGRHRAAAIIEAGGTRMPVAIRLYGKHGFHYYDQDISQSYDKHYLGLSSIPDTIHAERGLHTWEFNKQDWVPFYKSDETAGLNVDDVEYQVKRLADNRIDFLAIGPAYFAGKRSTHKFEIGGLRVVKYTDVWTGVSLNVDPHWRQRGIAMQLIRNAVNEVGPIRTSRMFSPSGKRQMEGLVRRGWADRLDHGDFLIHFGRKAEAKGPEPKGKLNANFWHWFGHSKIVDTAGNPRVMYHGTSRDFKEFQKKQANSIFLTFDPEIAEVYSIMSNGWMLSHIDEIATPEQLEDAKRKAIKRIRHDYKGQPKSIVMEMVKGYRETTQWLAEVKLLLATNPHIMPLYVRCEDPFDYENPTHIEAMLGYLEEVKYTPDSFEQEAIHSIKNGTWEVIERADVQKAIKALGHDGFWVKEEGRKNLAVYSGNQVKSAIGNDGSWSLDTNDITAGIKAPDTPEFEEWFDGSVVVDAKGEPLVVYHGTDADFKEFRPTGEGIFFTENPAQANRYANGDGGDNVIPVFLALKNPAPYSVVAKNDRRQHLMSLGYDGYVEQYANNRVFIVFQSTQVKSATGNNGDFDPMNPDITAAVGVPENSLGQPVVQDAKHLRAFKAWFKRSKVVDATSRPLVMYHGSPAANKILQEGFDPKFLGSGNDQYGSGYYFTADEAASRGYQRPGADRRTGELRKYDETHEPGSLPVYLSLQKPLDVSHTTVSNNDAFPPMNRRQALGLIRASSDWQDPDGPLSNYGDIGTYGLQSVLNDAVDNYVGQNPWTLCNDFYSDGEDIHRFLRAYQVLTGRDGLIVRKDDGSIGFAVAWFPEQIKAVANSGTFDPQQRSITAGWKDEVTPEQLKFVDDLDDAQTEVREPFQYDEITPSEDVYQSAEASFYDFKIPKGTRLVPISLLLDDDDHAYDDEKARIERLAEQIRENQHIAPLFVAVEPNGEAWLLEGQHRIRALKLLGFTHVPALLILSLDENEATANAVPSRESLIGRMEEAAKKNGYINCRLAVQLATGVAKLEELPTVDSDNIQPGDVLAWRQQHYAIWLGNDEVVNVEGWGEPVTVAKYSDVLAYWDEPTAIFRPSYGETVSAATVNGEMDLPGDVHADIEANPGFFVSIYSWSSKTPGQGNSVIALKYLRDQYGGRIVVHDPGEPGTESFSYWQHMKKKGLVDEIRDESGEVVANDDDHYDALKKTGFWGKQGAGCLVLAQRTGRFLIGLRSEYVQEPSTWGTFGGAIDGDEDPKDAVLRELKEETGCDQPARLEPLFVFKSGSFQYHNFLAIVRDEFEPQLNWENDGFKWVEFSNWPKPLHPGMVALLKDDASVAIMNRLSGAGAISNGLAKMPDPKVVGHEPLPSDSRYAYHITGVENLDSIHDHGLQVYEPWEGTEQDAWPDGKVEKRAYFASSPKTAFPFAPEHTGRPILLRMHKDSHDLHSELHTGDMFVREPVEPWKLQYLAETGDWINLAPPPEGEGNKGHFEGNK